MEQWEGNGLNGLTGLNGLNEPNGPDGHRALERPEADPATGVTACGSHVSEGEPSAESFLCVTDCREHHPSRAHPAIRRL
jgi:hypothetical protein